MDVTLLAEQVRARWLATGVEVRPAASEEEMDDFEKRHGLRLPREFRTYLAVMNGMTYGDTDEDLVHFMSLQTMAAEIEDSLEMLRAGFLTFAEYCLHCNVYALRLGEDPEQPAPVLCFLEGRQPAIPFAESFSAFLRDYLSGFSIFPPG